MHRRVKRIGFRNAVQHTPPIFHFVLVAGLQSFALGVYLWMRHRVFTHPVYNTLFSILPYNAMSVLLICAGALMIYGYLKTHLVPARVGLVLFATFYAMEATAEMIEFTHGTVSLWPFIKSLGMAGLMAVGAMSVYPAVNKT